MWSKFVSWLFRRKPDLVMERARREAAAIAENAEAVLDPMVPANNAVRWAELTRERDARAR